MNVRNNEAHSRFEIEAGGSLALLEYKRSSNNIIFLHTEVPEELRGQGLGEELAKAGLEFARQAGLKAVIRCPFVKRYLERHPELGPV